MTRGKRRQQQRRQRRRRQQQQQARAANRQLQEVEEEGLTFQRVIAELMWMMRHALWWCGVSNCCGDDDDDAAGSGGGGEHNMQSWENEAKKTPEKNVRAYECMAKRAGWCRYSKQMELMRNGPPPLDMERTLRRAALPSLSHKNGLLSLSLSHSSTVFSNYVVFVSIQSNLFCFICEPFSETHEISKS
jgi:hypothetical protein